MGLLAVKAVQKFEFPKSKMAAAAILKNTKAQHDHNGLNDFREFFTVTA